ncbi:MAG: tRNA (N(6)-L-threonylcarbamoyladenosine(37)-C(2))-methylthiotransferase MtaB [Pseudomonadota bacterium]
MSVDVVTFGCRLNITESESIRREAEAAGIKDAVIVNTCAVTAEAVRQARQAIRRSHRERPGAPIVVTGCAVQVYPEKFIEGPEVAIVVGNDQKISPLLWRDVKLVLGAGGDSSRNGPARSYVGDIMAETTMIPPRLDRIAGHTRGFVQIQNGCDHRCTFCIIPFGRGNSRSLSPDDVIAQVRLLAETGHREVVLTGVDITSYQPSLGALVKRILKDVPALERLRLSSIDSVEADADLLDAFATDARLMPHLHLSLQHGDDLILKRMKRRHSRADAIAFCAEMRRLRPDVVFGGDIIAGFPTETEAMFQRSLDLVDECGLTHLHVFPFSPRPGTPAALMPQVAGEVVKDRARRLRQHGAEALARHLQSEIGSTRRVLTERGGIGRTEQFTAVRLNAPVEPGVMLDVGIAAHDGRQLIAA